MVPMALFGVEVPGQQQSLAARPRRSQRLPVEEELEGLTLVCLGKLSTVWAGSWWWWGNETLLPSCFLHPIFVFDELGVTARNWGLCHKKLFPLNMFNVIFSRYLMGLRTIIH